MEPSSEKAVANGDRYHLQDRLFTAQLAPHSPLAGKTLAESRLGDVLGVNVVGIIRNGRTDLAPLPTAVLLCIGNKKRLFILLNSLKKRTISPNGFQLIGRVIQGAV